MPGTFLREVEGLRPGEHACLVYDDDERRDRALMAFLSQGVALGERVIYLASAPHDPVALALKAAAVSGQVQVLDSADCYLADGEFDPDRALEGFRLALVDAAESGYDVVRTAGGQPPAVTDNGHSRELPDYERRASALFDERRLVSVCTYDARRVPPGALLAIVDAHPIVLYAVGSDGRLEVRAAGGLVEAAGWLDVTTLGALVGPLAAALGGDGDVSVDLHDVDFVDVTALRMLTDAARELHTRGRRLFVSHVPSPVPVMLSLLGLSEAEGLVFS